MTTDIIAIVFFIVVMMMTAAVAIMTVIYATRLPSSRRTITPHPRNRPEARARSRTTGFKSRSKTGRAADKIPSPKKEPSAGRKLEATEMPETRVIQTGELKERRKPRANMSFLFKRAKPDGRKKAEEAVLAKQEEATVSSGQKTTYSSAAMPPSVAAQPGLVPDHHEGDADAGSTKAEPDKPMPTSELRPSGKEIASAADTKPVSGSANRSATPVAANPAAGNPASSQPPDTTRTGPAPEKSAMGDLSNLFARVATDDNKASKLAEGMSEVDIKDLLKEGHGLIGRLKKPGT